ncbi:hypothetical protein NX801_08610 [Streptomyces sp. LP05-1]|uniref:DUF6801 domain-containing protein n=1 Tax=Streptomyces pyxinae TaxID=2970734 RepID=A0ABT2CEB7_9ACTN|nr:DUF6801 domain-containing protein [Streptomyces sp. LP05-1]MCS0635723.1 hypothetical protein [Streptomyces sp. LP05-1]
MSASATKGREQVIAADYSCAAVNGAVSDRRVRVEVVFGGRFPDRGRAGSAVRVADFTIRPGLTRAAVRELLPAGTAVVSGTARLAADIALDGRGVRADWSGLVAARTAPDAGGGLAPVFTGAVPETTATRAGRLTVTGGELSLTLWTGPAEPPGPAEPTEPTGPSGPAGQAGPGGATAPGVPAGPGARARSLAGAPVEVRCGPLRPPGPRLVSWEVTASSGTPSGSPTAGAGVPGSGDTPPDPLSSSGTGPAGPDTPAGEPPVRTARAPRGQAPVCPTDRPRGELDPARLPKPPPGAVEGSIGGSLCTVAVGYATVRKQNAAMIVNDPRRTPGLMHLDLGRRTVSSADGGYTESDSLGVLHLPDADSTFLTFGFQPVSARVTFEPGPVTVVNVLRDGEQSTTVGYWQHLRIHHVRLNGVPLDVGSHCRTARRIDTRLSGAYPFITGGLLTGQITVPPFTGCRSASGEDLSRLFTAAISGPGNALRIQQGGLAGGGASPPVPPLPGR